MTAMVRSIFLLSLLAVVTFYSNMDYQHQTSLKATGTDKNHKQHHETGMSPPGVDHAYATDHMSLLKSVHGGDTVRSVRGFIATKVSMCQDDTVQLCDLYRKAKDKNNALRRARVGR